MSSPTAEELAAIVAAYLVVTGGDEPQRAPSGWLRAARLDLTEPDHALLAARTARWSAAGRRHD